MAGILSEPNQSPWLLLDAADTIFSLAKKRVYVKRDKSSMEDDDEEGEGERTAAIAEELGLPKTIWPVLEEQPKWQVVRDALREIELEKQELERRGEGNTSNRMKDFTLVHPF
jgi:DNA excision repair protein ERCC-4